MLFWFQTPGVASISFCHKHNTIHSQIEAFNVLTTDMGTERHVGRGKRHFGRIGKCHSSIPHFGTVPWWLKVQQATWNFQNHSIVLFIPWENSIFIHPSREGSTSLCVLLFREEETSTIIVRNTNNCYYFLKLTVQYLYFSFWGLWCSQWWFCYCVCVVCWSYFSSHWRCPNWVLSPRRDLPSPYGYEIGGGICRKAPLGLKNILARTMPHM